MKFLRLLCIYMLFACGLFSCANNTANLSLYDELGGQTKIQEIANRIIEEIGKNDSIVVYFKRTNIDRFHAKFVEHICQVSDGPCTYTGDTMEQTHAGMMIGETDFNLVVDLLIEAMNQSAIPHTTQNKLLARLVPMRVDIMNK